MKTIQIEIRQQNETCNLHNVYVGYDNKSLQLHTMALSLDESKLLALDIIIANNDCKPEILIDTF